VTVKMTKDIRKRITFQEEREQETITQEKGGDDDTRSGERRIKHFISRGILSY
jgi:hypothetical protein